MKELILIISLLLSSVFLLLKNEKSGFLLKTGDIAFTAFNATKEEGFAIISFVEIQPHTKIYFTDTEWDGNHFGLDENDLVWDSGKDTIKAFTEIIFKSIECYPKASRGFINGTLRLSKKKDALFAYIGNFRMPKVFLAAVANHSEAYGILVNTGLEEGYTAVTYPNHTIKASFISSGPEQNRPEYIAAVNDMGNYEIEME